MLQGLQFQESEDQGPEASAGERTMVLDKLIFGTIDDEELALPESSKPRKHKREASLASSPPAASERPTPAPGNLSSTSICLFWPLKRKLMTTVDHVGCTSSDFQESIHDDFQAGQHHDDMKALPHASASDVSKAFSRLVLMFIDSKTLSPLLE